MAITRRAFLTRVGRVGGYSAAYMMMRSLGLLAIPASVASTVTLGAGSGKGKSVVILGAGIAGLVAAYELHRAGYQCTVLEARSRCGGRNWTIRRGTKFEMTDGTAQVCDFDEGHYFNAGPARLPSQHRTILNYCRELSVPLEVEVNCSRSSLLQSDSLERGKAVEQRQVVNDTRGHISELLAKAVNRKALDEELSSFDLERMLAFLRKYGDLTADYKFKGTSRSGYKVPPGAGDQNGIPREPLDMHTLLNADLWEAMLFEEVFDMQATMLQPVGGMDRIPAAFEKRLEDIIRYDSPVCQIRKTGAGVKVVYKDVKSATTETVEANYCICALPLSILKTLDTDLAADLKQAIDATEYDSAYKIAWESRRFWEQDYSIYGGLSFAQQTVGVIWYPSWGLFTDRGVIVAGYGVENGIPFGSFDLNAKLGASRAAIEHVHPGHARELEKPIYVSWGHIPFNLGSWVTHFGKTTEDPVYARLLAPDGPIFLAGDHVSHLVGWQEGAALSAHRAIQLIDQNRPSQRAQSA